MRVGRHVLACSRPMPPLGGPPMIPPWHKQWSPSPQARSVSDWRWVVPCNFRAPNLFTVSSGTSLGRTGQGPRASTGGCVRNAGVGRRAIRTPSLPTRPANESSPCVRRIGPQSASHRQWGRNPPKRSGRVLATVFFGLAGFGVRSKSGNLPAVGTCHEGRRSLDCLCRDTVRRAPKREASGAVDQ